MRYINLLLTLTLFKIYINGEKSSPLSDYYMRACAVTLSGEGTEFLGLMAVPNTHLPPLVYIPL